MKQGKIIKINKAIYTVLLKDNIVLDCSIRGKLRYLNQDPVVGDNVILDENNTIKSLLERKNSLIRPLVANIDLLLIVCSTKVPEFSTYLIDKFLVLSYYNKIEPVLIITKMDLLNHKEKKAINKYIKYYKKLGIKVLKNNEISKIKKLFKNKTVALTGQTGSGKTTLLNKIDKNLKLKTGEVSLALNRGKHTTRLVELLHVNCGLVADTPGFSSLEIEVPLGQIKNYFKEFNIKCKYTSCLHQGEEGCNVIKKLNNELIKERYKNYLKLIKKE